MLARIRVWRDACFPAAMQAHRVVVAALLLVACDEPIGIGQRQCLRRRFPGARRDGGRRQRGRRLAHFARRGERTGRRVPRLPVHHGADLRCRPGFLRRDRMSLPGCGPDAATPGCVVPGVGTLAGRKVLDTDGVLSTYNLSATGTGSHQYFVIVRRVTVAGTAATSLKATIIIGANDGCASEPVLPRSSLDRRWLLTRESVLAGPARTTPERAAANARRRSLRGGNPRSRTSTRSRRDTESHCGSR